VGRFHEKHPISAKNPLTNKRIIGEVEFYKVKNPELNRASNEEIARKATLAIEKLKASESTKNKDIPQLVQQ
jgi:hypothetical protein